MGKPGPSIKSKHNTNVLPGDNFGHSSGCGPPGSINRTVLGFQSLQRMKLQCWTAIVFCTSSHLCGADHRVFSSQHQEEHGSHRVLCLWEGTISLCPESLITITSMERVDVAGPWLTSMDELFWNIMVPRLCFCADLTDHLWNLMKSYLGFLCFSKPFLPASVSEVRSGFVLANLIWVRETCQKMDFTSAVSFCSK